MLGLDLGTNSIGWAIRETDIEERRYFLEKFQEFLLNEKTDKEINEILKNEIINYGVIVFEKGVGDGKSGEFSLAAERRKNRSKRRLYNAKRYRKWALLKVLIENKMCPLSQEDLILWSIGNWEKRQRNKGRIYPKNEEWLKWLAMDEKYFGHKGLIEKNHEGKPSYIRKNPYDLRCELIEQFEGDEELRKYKIGRALYHFAQRRGFKTSRKSGKSGYAKNEEIEKAKAENNELQLSQFINQKYFQQNQRFRATGVIQRKYYEEEFLAICEKQELDKTLSQQLFDAVYFVRPLRTQKGLVGKCTLEPNKPRIPISHPLYEEFRALQKINDIKWRETGSNKGFEPIKIDLKKKIFEQLFFRKISGGKNKDKIDERSYFKFEEIVKEFSENNKYEFNFAKYDIEKLKEENKYELTANPSISVCPVIAGLMNVFDKEWKDKFISDESKFGINWSNLSLNYKIKYVSKKESGKGLKRKGKKYVEKEIGKDVKLDHEGIWHLLFDYLQTKDKEDDLKKFCKEVIGWKEDEKIKQFCEISIEQGYGSLSRNAISKIVPYLQEESIYTEAVLYANLPKVLGKEYFQKNKDKIKEEIKGAIKQIDKQKEKLEIVNGLIQKYFGELETIKKKGLDDIIKEQAKKDVEKKLKGFFGTTNWNNKAVDEQKEYYDFVLEKYLKFLDGKQQPEEKASSRQGKNPEIDYYKLPRLDNAIKQKLKDKFSATEEGLKYLYHPSDIDIYPKSKTSKNIVDKRTGEILRVAPQLESPEPPSKGWKNPMAMRTMYELKYLVNYLLQVGKIDTETKIVIEIARELNDANRRKALEYWNNDKETENKEYANAMVEMFNINNPSDEDFNKFKAAVEQLNNYTFSNNKEETFKKKYEDFVKTYITGEIQKDKDENDEIVENTENEKETVSYDYLMYLILTRDNFIRLLSSRIPNSRKVIKQIIKPVKDFQNRRNALKEIITKYRLWKEQKFQCFYTGRYISFQELMEGAKCQIEHTIPRSISFDTELKNLTVCDAVYNNDVKNNAFPKDCPNYYKTVKCKTVKGEIECTPIVGRVEQIIKPKVVELRKRIENLKAKSRKIPTWEKDKKDANIRLRHYLQFELEYWEKKLLTFTVERKDWKDKWKNSQLVDTQIISKYARAYMKSVFNRVDVLKARQNAEDTQDGMVNLFKKIYSISNYEKKDRSRHSHHAIDAAVLTLIPNSAKREELLKEYYLSLEHKTKNKFTSIPYPFFNREHVISIDQNVLINHITRDKTLIGAKKKLRKRGKVQYSIVEHLPEKFKNKKEGVDYFRVIKDGKEQFKISEFLEGDSIRGQLHEETFLGAIKVAKRNEQGFAVKENGKYELRKNKNGQHEILLVKRKPVKDIKIDDVLDPLLKKHLQNQLGKGIPQEELTDFAGNKIRHLRFEVFKPNFENALALKKHTHLSKKEHKQVYRTNNAPGSNEVCLFYSGTNKKQQLIFQYRFINLLEYSRIEGRDFFKNPDYNTFIKSERKDEYKLSLTRIFYKGDKVIVYKNSLDEIDKNISQKLHLFKILKFNNSGSDYMFLQNHIEARPDKELGDGETEFISEKYQARLKLTADKFKFLVEGKDFEIKPDGEIKWL